MPPQVEEEPRIKTPDTKVLRSYAVICGGAKCGLVGVREKKEEANRLASDHRDMHATMARRADELLQQWRAQRDATELADAPGVEEIITDMLVAGPSLHIPAEEAPKPYVGFGYLDWQFGSAASGRDPAMMWHRRCGGECQVFAGVLVCTVCERADTPSGTLRDSTTVDVSTPE